MEQGEAFELERRLPIPMRFVLVAAGLFCILTPTFDLGRVILQIGWWTPFLGAILIGAWALGAIFLAAAIMGETQHWQFRDGELILSRKSLLKHRTEIIRGSDVERTEIREVEWDSRANTFSVVLRLKNGAEFETPDYGTRDAADVMKGRIGRALGGPPTRAL
jgi:uncharacterized membrane protein YdbT with pleckstrin-like domain